MEKKRNRIKINTLINNVAKGGIGIIDVESKFYAAKASWISRIINVENIIYRKLSSILQHDAVINQLRLQRPLGVLYNVTAYLSCSHCTSTAFERAVVHLAAFKKRPKKLLLRS